MWRLRRSQRGMIFGVCEGLGESFEMDPSWLRLAFVVLAFAGGIGVILYGLLGLALPVDGNGGNLLDTVRENIEDLITRLPYQRQSVGLVLVVAGLLLFFGKLGFLSWIDWGTAFAMAVVAVGMSLLWKPRT